MGEDEALLRVRQLGIGEFEYLPRQPPPGLDRLIFARPEDLVGTIGGGYDVARNFRRLVEGAEGRSHISPLTSDHYELSMVAAPIIIQKEAAEPACVETLSDVEFLEYHIELGDVGSDGEGDNAIRVPKRHEKDIDRFGGPTFEGRVGRVQHGFHGQYLLWIALERTRRRIVKLGYEVPGPAPQDRPRGQFRGTRL